MSERRERLVELAREGLAAYERGDMETVLELLDPEVEVIVSQMLPNPESGGSQEEFLAWVGRWEDAWESFTIEVIAIDVLDDHHVIANVRQRGVGAGSGVEVEMEVFWMFEWDGERTKRVGLFVTRDEALAAARGR